VLRLTGAFYFEDGSAAYEVCHTNTLTCFNAPVAIGFGEHNLVANYAKVAFFPLRNVNNEQILS
jgi:hypothetical protein